MLITRILFATKAHAPQRGGGDAGAHRPAGRGAHCAWRRRLCVNEGIESVFEVNLVEDVGRQLSVEDNSVEFDLAPFEIKTLKVQLRSYVK